jgi:hypothetical protein
MKTAATAAISLSLSFSLSLSLSSFAATGCNLNPACGRNPRDDDADAPRGSVRFAAAAATAVMEGAAF